MYDFEIKRINQEIRKRKAKRVLIQLPEGLKHEFVKIADKLAAEAILSGDPCFGACDIQTTPETDLTIHFGHSKMLDTDRIIYVETRSAADIGPVATKAARMLTGKRVGLVTTIQHVKELPKVKRILERLGKKVVIGGPVLGCDASNAQDINTKVDEFLFIGSGRFHGIGVAYFTGKKVLLADPYTNIVSGIDPLKSYKEKYLRIAKASDSLVFGIIIGSKPGQRKMGVAEKARKTLERRGKRTYLVIMNEITPERLDYLPFDAFVVTACPRIVIDDWKNYKKPLLLPEEI